METIADAVAATGEHDGVAFDAPGRGTGHSYDAFQDGVRKAANLLRQYGVRSGARVAVVVGPKAPDEGDVPGYLAGSIDPLLAALGGTLLGGVVDPAPATDVDAAALVAPSAWLDRYETAPGTTRLAYGGPPDDPAVARFERERWSENPVEPPESVDAGEVAVDDGTAYTHADVLAMAGTPREALDLEPGVLVAVETELDGPAIAAGVVAPLLAGATIVGGDATDADVRVGRDGAVDPASLTDLPGTRRT